MLKIPCYHRTTMQTPCFLESLATEYISPKTPADYATAVALSTSFDFGRQDIIEGKTHSGHLSLERTFVGLPAFEDELENYEGGKQVTECTSSWGDFEGFGESIAKSESFNCTLEALRSTSKSKNFQEDIPHGELHCSTSCDKCGLSQMHGQDAKTTGSSPVEDRKDYANIFKSSFPEIPVQEPPENVKSFEQLFKANEEENELAKVIKTQLCMDFWNVWRMAYDAKISPGLEYPCRESRKNLLLALGVDSREKDATAELNRISKSSTIEDMAILSKVDDLKVDASKSLIQTKLLVPPDSKHGQGFSYQLYLKRAPSNSNKPAVTFSGKKSIFARNNLIMKS